jgi:GT2 family glycosyltransferase
MNPIPVLGIPHYNRPDLLIRCIESIDYPVDILVIVRNGPLLHFPFDHIVKMRGCSPTHYVTRAGGIIKRVEVTQHPNAGCAGAWNEIVKLFPADYWLLSNNDIQFTPGDLEKMASTAGGTVIMEKQGDLKTPGVIYGNHGASWFVLTQRAVNVVGLFDENIFPAYLEDCDHSYRCDLLNVRRTTITDVCAIHGEGKMPGSCTVNSDPSLRAKNALTHTGNFEYYKAKWGGVNERETFKTPFNDPTWPVWAWKFDVKHRSNQQW